MAPDHSLTYKQFKFRNIPHILRKKQLSKLISTLHRKPNIYTDFGCSNGYLTNIFADILTPNEVNGFDHSDNIEVARSNYPDINFDYVNLNKVNNFDKKSDIISCFETMEHVGNSLNAIKNLKEASHQGSIILISVPIEIGFIGIIKYIAKRFLLKYELPLNCKDLEYFCALLTSKYINQYRVNADGYGSHFGFDYRIIDEEIKLEFPNCKVEMWNKITTRFYRIRVG
jgi:2-polyprenyl-3-methyl-5-hydroxy-6-metoxy-1,4-benzoquinol methylase